MIILDHYIRTPDGVRHDDVDAWYDAHPAELGDWAHSGDHGRAVAVRQLYAFIDPETGEVVGDPIACEKRVTRGQP